MGGGLKKRSGLEEYRKHAYYCPRCDSIVIDWAYIENLFDELRDNIKEE